MKKPIIAIDGPAGSGKTTVALALAGCLGLPYVDSGAMYRALTWKAMSERINLEDEASLSRLAARAEFDYRFSLEGTRVHSKGEDITHAIRSQEVTRNVRYIAASPGVRHEMVRQQREMARDGGCVMEGRDIGTNVFPDADLKIYLVADAEERARRRMIDIEKAGEKADFQKLVGEIEARDQSDAARDVAPLKRADNAIDIDSTDRTVEAIVDEIQRHLKSSSA